MDEYFRQRGLPNLVDAQSKITSPPTFQYNCIAWAFGDSTKWWWPDDHPDSHWPFDCSEMSELQAFEEWFEQDGWTLAENEAFESGIRKVALYADADGKPTHAARLIGDGQWTSKLGPLHDISHGPKDLDGPAYGTVVKIYQKPE